MGLFTRKDAESRADQKAQIRLRLEVETVHAVLARYAPGSSLHFGAPTRCPSCGDFGFVKAVNRTGGASHLHCFGCRHDWTITLAALKAVHEEALAAAATTPTCTPAPPAPMMAAPSIATRTPPAAPAPAVDQEPIVLDDPYRTVTVTARTTPPATFASMPPLPSVPDGTGRRLRVLAIDDNPFDAAVIVDLVDGLPDGPIDLVNASTRFEGEQLAAVQHFDLILLDLNLPDSSGITTLLEWQLGPAHRVPVIVVSGGGSPEIVQEARHLGASQFVHKQHLADLLNAPDGSTKLLRLVQSTIERAARSHQT